MEIQPPGINRIQKNAETKKKERKTVKNSFADAVDDRATTSISKTTAVFQVDPMFTNLDEPSSRQKAIQNGLSLLDELEKLRNELLGGAIGYNTILEIQDYIKQINIDDVDDHLRGLLLEIETRAVVELAKYRKTV